MSSLLEVFCWGRGTEDQLGNGLGINSNIPVLVASLPSSAPIAIAAGRSHCLVVTDDQVVYAWGSNSHGQCGIPPPEEEEEGEEDSSQGPPPRTIPLSGDGAQHVVYPTAIAALSSENIVAIAAGHFFSAALSADGSLFTWGRGNEGQLAVGTAQVVPIPRKVPLSIPLIHVACGTKHLLALSLHGDCYAAGRGMEGQLGLGAAFPVSLTLRYVAALRSIPCVGISCGDNFSAAVSSRGEVFSWGQGSEGQLGHGEGISEPLPRWIKTLPSCITSIACGSSHMLACDGGDQLWSWGSNMYGQCGLGHRSVVTTPQLVTLPSTPLTSMAAGHFYSLALTAGGELFSWGHCAEGRLALPNPTDRHEPQLVFMLSGHQTLAVAAGYATGIALGMKLPEETGMHPLDAAVRLQSNWRGYSDRKRVRELRDAEQRAAAEAARKQRESEAEAAVLIQAAMRGYLVRKERASSKEGGD
jgi:alpha-tubulin suppressor-like RCC1 family protein